MDNQQPSFGINIFYLKPKKGYGFIYKYTSPSGKSYIGQTINSLSCRAKNIFTGVGYKKCSLFWKAIQKYGWQQFKVEILGEYTVSELNEYEKYNIYKFNTLAPAGYNLTIGGDGGKTKEVYVYSAQNGQFLEHCSSLSQASELFQIPISTISLVMKQEKRKRSHNLVFLSEYIEKYDINNFDINKHHKVYMYDKNGFYKTEFPSITQAADTLKIGTSSIRKCLNGNANHASYYQFKDYKVDKIEAIEKNSKAPISVIQIDPITLKEIAHYPSLAAAARAVGLTSSNGIKKVIIRGKGTSGGYFWKKEEGSTTKCE